MRLTTTELARDPHPRFRDLRQSAPVWRLPGADAVMVTSWALVAEAAARTADFSNHFRHSLFRRDDDGVGVIPYDAGTDVLAGADPPTHAEHRRLFFPELVQRRIAGLEDVVVHVVHEHLDPLLRAGGGDVASQLADLIPLRIVVEHVLGIPDADVTAVRQWIYAGAQLMGGRLTLDEMGPAAEQAAPLLTWVSEHLDRAVAGGVADGVLAAAADGVRRRVLARDEAAFALMVLVGAGAETTSALIGHALRVIAERPEVQDALRRAPTCVAPFLEEILRLESPFRFHPRTATADTELGGVDIAAGSLVLLCWASANRDDAVFDAADELVIGRPDGHRHLAFGRGIHHCVGAPLARLEARVAVEAVLAATSNIEVDRSSRQRLVDSVWVHRHDALSLVLSPGR